MKQRLRVLLTLVLLGLAFSAVELGSYDLAQSPVAESLHLASPGPIAQHTHNLLDRLNEWRAHTPELSGMIHRLVEWSLLWTLLKAIAFPWAILSALQPQRAKLLGLTGFLGVGLQLVFLGLPRLLLYAGLVFCAQGLMGSNPFVPLAMGALLCLLIMLQVSCDLAQVRAMYTTGKGPISLHHAARALRAWVTTPRIMLQASLLRIAQIAVATGPLLEQIQQRPGPNSPRAVLYFIAASFLLWALRLWMLARPLAATRCAPAPTACRSELAVGPD